MISSTTLRRTFRGGTHPPQSKFLTAECVIRPIPAVGEIAVMLSQHTGAVCEPLVGRADSIGAGQKIGDADAFVSAPVHSPVGGKVKRIALRSHAVLGRAMAVIIEADPEGNTPGRPVPGRFTEDFDASTFSEEQILNAVREAGIVGMGGAGFPTHVKLRPDPPKETLIVNGCECEPYITCDYRIMLEWTHQIIAGVRLAQKASGCRRVLIAIEDNKPGAVRAFAEALGTLKGTDNIELVSVRTKYPQGGERQLIEAILNRNVPTGGIPPVIGVLVLNVATLAAIAEAVVCNRPLTHRVVTVTGETVVEPGNYYVPIGTKVADLLEFCGPLPDDAARVVLGGPMMGIAIGDLNTPVTKTTGAVTVLTQSRTGKARFAGRRTACIRCGRCLEACPENLNPTKIAHAVKNNLLDLAESYYIKACIECGCCSYVCPANIELTGYIKAGKTLLAGLRKRIPE